MQTAPRPLRNPPRTQDQKNAERLERISTDRLVKAAGRAVRRRMEAVEHVARRVAAQATGCVIDVDPTREGDFGDGSGYEIRPRNPMSPGYDSIY